MNSRSFSGNRTSDRLGRLAGLVPAYHDFSPRPWVISYVGSLEIHLSHTNGECNSKRHVCSWILMKFGSDFARHQICSRLSPAVWLQCVPLSSARCPQIQVAIAILFYDHLITIGRSNVEEYPTTKTHVHSCKMLRLIVFGGVQKPGAHIGSF